MQAHSYASVAKLVDAVDSKSTGLTPVPVRVRPLVPRIQQSGVIDIALP